MACDPIECEGEPHHAGHGCPCGGSGGRSAGGWAVWLGGWGLDSLMLKEPVLAAVCRAVDHGGEVQN